MADKQYSGFADSNEALILGVVVAAVAFTAATIGTVYVGGLLGLDIMTHLKNFWSIGVNPPDYVKIALMVILGISALAGIMTTAAMLRGSRMETHVSGLQMGDARALNAGEKVGIKQTGKGISFGGVTLSRRRETGHMLVLGLPGSGKTVLLNTIVQQIVDDIESSANEEEKPDRLVIHDPKGDFTGWMPVDKSLLYGPWDKRSVAWDIAHDLNSEALASEAAAAWIKDSKDPMFSEAARGACEGLLMYLMHEKPGAWTLQDLADILKLEPAKVVGIAIKGFPANAANLVLDEEGNPITTTSNILTTMASALKWVHQAAAAERSATERFSMFKWLMEAPKKPILILKADARYPNASQGLFALILKVANNTICSPEMPEVPASAPGIWFVLDEFPQMGKASGEIVRTLQEFGRSRGARVITAAQDMSQYLDIYGREGGRVQTSLQQTVVLARQSDESAQEIANRMGKRLVNRWSGSMSKSSGYSESISQQEASVIAPHHLTRLAISKKGPEVICAIEGQPAKLVVPFPKGIKQTQAQAVGNPAFDNGMSGVQMPMNEPKPGQADTPDSGPKQTPVIEPEAGNLDDLFKVHDGDDAEQDPKPA
jgi:hypothetical protein